MRIVCLLIFVPIVFFNCAWEQQTGQTASKCHWPGPDSDSILLDDFRKHGILNVPEPFVPNADTMYCFRGDDSWGDFDYLCSIYCDGTSYKSSITSIINRKDGIDFEEKVRSIGLGEWQQIRSEFHKINFWCDSQYVTQRLSIDGHRFYVTGKEGGKYREICWDQAETNFKDIRILGKKIGNMCGLPADPVSILYKHKGDSIYADIFIDWRFDFFIEKIDFQNHSFSTSSNDWFEKIVIHKRDLDSLRRIIITEHSIDGSTRRVNVTQLRRRY